MRVTDKAGDDLGTVYLSLSDDQAMELAEVLNLLIESDEGWHGHVNSASETHEVTVYRDTEGSVRVAFHLEPAT